MARQSHACRQQGIGDTARNAGIESKPAFAFGERGQPRARPTRLPAKDAAQGRMATQGGLAQAVLLSSSQEALKPRECACVAFDVGSKAGLPQFVDKARRAVVVAPGRKPRKTLPKAQHGRNVAGKSARLLPRPLVTAYVRKCLQLLMPCTHGKPAHPACLNTLAYHLGHKHVGKLRRMRLQQTRPLPRRQKAEYQPRTLHFAATKQQLNASASKFLIVLNAHAHARIPHSEDKGRATEQSPHGINAEHGKVERKLLKLAGFAESADRRHIRQPSVAQHHHRPTRKVCPVRKGFDKDMAHDMLARVQEARIATRVARTDARACPHQRGDTVRQLLDIHVAGNGQPARPHAHFLLRHTEHVRAEKVRMGKDPWVESAAGHAGNHDVRSPTCPKMQRAGKIRHLVVLEARKVVDQQQRPCFLALACVFLARANSARPWNRKPAKMQPDGARGAMHIARGNP